MVSCKPTYSGICRVSGHSLRVTDSVAMATSKLESARSSPANKDAYCHSHIMRDLQYLDGCKAQVEDGGPRSYKRTMLRQKRGQAVKGKLLVR